MKASRAGIPPFCKKPLCLNLEAANALITAVGKLDIPFGFAHTNVGHWTSRLGRYIVPRSLVALRAGIIYDLASPDSMRKEG